MEADAQLQESEPTKWYPLNVQTEEEMRAYDALRDELPASIEHQFWSWVASVVREQGAWDDYRILGSMAMALDFQLPAHFINNAEFYREGEVARMLCERCAPFDAADYLLAHSSVAQRSAKQLEYYLKGARVNWMVGMRHGKPGLVKRIPDGISDAAKGILAGADKASSEYLAEAWSKFYGLNQDLPASYANAIKAVEAALKPLIAPNDTMSTLGKILSTVRNQEWELSASRTDQKVSSHDVLKAMISQLWAGQSGRHGGNSEEKPLTERDVAVALGLAFSIVHFVNEDALYRGRQGKMATS